MIELFVDLDGVLADFDSMIVSQFGLLPQNFKSDEELWKRIHEYYELNGEFFNHLDPMDDYETLWKYVEPLNPKILTATGHSIASASDEKKEWVKRHLGDHVEVITVVSSRDKSEYCKGSNFLLIDDRLKSIHPWVLSGGVGILHEDAVSSVNSLQSLLTNYHASCKGLDYFTTMQRIQQVHLDQLMNS